ncbi:MAG: hypothetical protein AB7K71_08340 [Polyangiaceae bacterium]
MILKWLSVVALGGAVLAMAACTSDDEPASGKGKEADCEAIIEACHMKDDGSGGDITSCHETAHETSEGTDYSFCTANKTRCVALCDAAPDVSTGGSGTGGHSHGGAGGDAGTGGHSHGGAGGESHSGGTGGESHAGGAGGTTGGAAGAGGAGTGGHSHGGAGGAAGSGA